jgi:hypothetical protein
MGTRRRAVRLGPVLGVLWRRKVDLGGIGSVSAEKGLVVLEPEPCPERNVASGLRSVEGYPGPDDTDTSFMKPISRRGRVTVVEVSRAV